MGKTPILGTSTGAGEVMTGKPPPPIPPTPHDPAIAGVIPDSKGVIAKTVDDRVEPPRIVVAEIQPGAESMRAIDQITHQTIATLKESVRRYKRWTYGLAAFVGLGLVTGAVATFFYDKSEKAADCDERTATVWAEYVDNLKHGKPSPCPTEISPKVSPDLAACVTTDNFQALKKELCPPNGIATQTPVSSGFTASSTTITPEIAPSATSSTPVSTGTRNHHR